MRVWHISRGIHLIALSLYLLSFQLGQCNHKFGLESKYVAICELILMDEPETEQRHKVVIL